MNATPDSGLDPAISARLRHTAEGLVPAHDWRRASGVADTLPLPLAWLEEQERRSVTDAPGVPERTRALAAELAGRPSYTYFLGGEERYPIAWSPTERRFVTIWACC